MNPQELLEYLLTGNELTPNQLDTFIKEHPREGQWHDFKDGRITSKSQRSTKRKEIPRWVSAFANAEGGVLIIGVSETSPRKKRSISPCDDPVGNELLPKWVANLLLPYAGLLVPPPRFQVVQHSKGAVLLIVVARAPMLFPVIYKGKSTYFLRIGDTSPEAPAYLISDLLLRRRERPLLEATDWSVQVTESVDRSPALGEAPTLLRVRLNVTLENMGLVRAEEIVTGAVAWWCSEDGKRKVNKYLRSQLEISREPEIPARLDDKVWSLFHTRSGASPCDIDRFSAMTFSFNVTQFPIGLGEVQQEISIGFYVSSAILAAEWYQLDFRYSESGNPRLSLKGPDVTQMTSRRPRVSHNFLPSEG